jgi:aryl-alcohol dehydrogenase-like predicted oxidoreductase
MEVRPLGRSGLSVSAIGLGVMTFGAQTEPDAAFEQLDLALERGVTLFDAAENYPAPTVPETQGRSEEILGAWIRARQVRDQVVVATKVTGPRGLPHIRGEARRLDRPNIRAAIEGSLRRLGTDRIDLYQVHWPDRLITTATRSRYVYRPDGPEVVAIAETLEALEELVQEGKIRHVGVANETPWGVLTYLRIARECGWSEIVSVQNGYSLLNRWFELAMAEVSVRDDVPLIAYSPLSGGLLSGKYLSARGAETGNRMSLFPGWDDRAGGERLEKATAGYSAIARKYGLNLAAMALAFAMSRPFTSSVLVGASRLDQLEANLQCVDVVLPAELVKDIDALHDTDPNPFR